MEILAPLFFALVVLVGETDFSNDVQINTCERVDMGGYYNLVDPNCN